MNFGVLDVYKEELCEGKWWKQDWAKEEVTFLPWILRQSPQTGWEPWSKEWPSKGLFCYCCCFDDIFYFQDFCLCFSPKISQKGWFLFIYPARASNQQNDETNSTTMKAKRQYNIIFKMWRENNFNQNFVLCETCKHEDALPDPLQRKTCCSVAGSGLADTLQLQSCLT